MPRGGGAQSARPVRSGRERTFRRGGRHLRRGKARAARSRNGRRGRAPLPGDARRDHELAPRIDERLDPAVPRDQSEEKEDGVGEEDSGAAAHGAGEGRDRPARYARSAPTPDATVAQTRSQPARRADEGGSGRTGEGTPAASARSPRIARRNATSLPASGARSAASARRASSMRAAVPRLFDRRRAPARRRLLGTLRQPRAIRLRRRVRGGGRRAPRRAGPRPRVAPRPTRARERGRGGRRESLGTRETRPRRAPRRGATRRPPGSSPSSPPSCGDVSN